MAKKYKLKTHKGTAKRFKITGSGKVMRTKGGKTHFRRRRSQRVKSKLSKMLVLKSSTDAKRVKLLAPYLRLYKQNPPS